MIGYGFNENQLFLFLLILGDRSIYERVLKKQSEGLSGGYFDMSEF
jgi:hypothetical protein